MRNNARRSPLPLLLAVLALLLAAAAGSGAVAVSAQRPAATAPPPSPAHVVMLPLVQVYHSTVPNVDDIAYVALGQHIERYHYYLRIHAAGFAGPADCTSVSRPVWSPDGSQIAAFLKPHDREWGLYVLRAGKDPLIVADNLADFPAGPTSSPDGSQVAYAAAGAEHISIATLSAEGVVTRSLATGLAARELAWSPDGAWIAFTAVGAEPLADLYIVATDGSGLQRLAQAVVHRGLSWAPDGSALAYGTNRISELESTSVPLEGGGVLDLVACPGRVPTWSPDGRSIAYDVLEGPDAGVYVTDADGASVRKVAEGYDPSWSPNPRFIAYEYPASHISLPLTNEVRITDLYDPSQADIVVAISAGSPSWRPRVVH